MIETRKKEKKEKKESPTGESNATAEFNKNFKDLFPEVF